MTGQDFRIQRDRVVGQPPDEAAWLAIEDIYDELKLPYKPDDRFDALTEGQRAVYILHWVHVRDGRDPRAACGVRPSWCSRSRGSADRDARVHLRRLVLARRVWVC